MSESKHTPETARALATVAIFDRGVSWQADATAALKNLAAEVERLREENRQWLDIVNAAWAEVPGTLRERAAKGGATHPLVDAVHLLKREDSEALAAERRKVEALREALSAMLTHMGMDEDDWNKPTFDQARAALAATEGGK